MADFVMRFVCLWSCKNKESAIHRNTQVLANDLQSEKVIIAKTLLRMN